MSLIDLLVFDCGTINWRICRLGGEQILGKDGGKYISFLTEPQLISLSTFTNKQLPVGIFLDNQNCVKSYGDTAYKVATYSTKSEYLREAFKIFIGDNQPSTSFYKQHYSYNEALLYTKLLLEKVLDQMELERPDLFDNKVILAFTHPKHWGRELVNGKIEGQILTDFAFLVRELLNKRGHSDIKFISEIQASLTSLISLKLLSLDKPGYTLVVDIGGETSLAAGKLLWNGLEDLRYFSVPQGSNIFDCQLAENLAELLKITDSHYENVWLKLRSYGKQLKEHASIKNNHQDSDTIIFHIYLNLSQFDYSSPNFIERRLVLKREQFEELLQEAVVLFTNIILRSLGEMDLEIKDISQIALVGGGAKLYLIPQIIRRIFGNDVLIVSSDLCEEFVVKGAALWMAQNSYSCL